jgi:hypothetical protein
MKTNIKNYHEKTVQQRTSRVPVEHPGLWRKHLFAGKGCQAGNASWKWEEGELKYADSFSETDPEDADYVKMLRLINEFLPVKELAGKIINVPVLRQFGLVENEQLDRFLATAFGKPAEREGRLADPKPKRVRAKASQSE